ncbi:MAG: DUF2029 domain-containing protein [Crocinitomicaceae bacterium]|nr:DUF2029 domain-containing protein [Crocinitomicaceae bacterium]
MNIPKLKIERFQLLFYVFICLFLGLFFTVETVNGKLWTNDFVVYYGAVQDFFNGNDPYVTNYGLDTGYFKYPPFTLYLFGYNFWLPFPVAKIVHLVLSSFALLYSIPVLAAMIREMLGIRRNYAWVLYLGFFSVAIHLVREFHMGNVNLILLGLFVYGLSHLKSTTVWYTVISWSLMIIIKPITIVALFPLLFFRQWKYVFYSGLCGIFFFLFPLVHLGWDAGIKLWSDWLTAVSGHGEYIVGYNSLRFLALTYFGVSSEWGPSLIFLSVLLLLMLVDVSKHNHQRQLFRWMVVFMAFVPNFFVTDTQHFLLSVPLILFLIYELITRRSVVAWSVFVLGFGLFSLNSNDLLGSHISDFMYIKGMLGIGNLLFIGLYIFVFMSNEKRSRVSQVVTFGSI